MRCSPRSAIKSALDEKNEKNEDEGKENPSNDDQTQNKDDNKDKNDDQETQATLDAERRNKLRGIPEEIRRLATDPSMDDGV